MSEIDAKLVRELDALGLSQEAYRAILLLPLVEVAWVDGEIQPQERVEILSYAEGNQLLAGDAHKVVEDWLTNRPTDDYFARGRKVLVRLAHQSEGFANDIGPGEVDDIVQYCEVVADSAGGLFGRFFRSSSEEKEAIRKIAVHVARLSSELDG